MQPLQLRLLFNELHVDFKDIFSNRLQLRGRVGVVHEGAQAGNYSRIQIRLIVKLRSRRCSDVLPTDHAALFNGHLIILAEVAHRTHLSSV